ncbi:MAG: hypothetical protein ACRCW3_00760 [Metamycoplasmataceae bacterium]
MKILSLITHPHVIPNLQDLRSSSEHKVRYFWRNPSVFFKSSIEGNEIATFNVKKSSKNIAKIVNMTTVVQP